MRHQDKWNAAVTSRLVALRDQGLSLDEIAACLREETGQPYSRDMVHGKIDRMALPQRPIQLVRMGTPDVVVAVDGYLLRISIERPATAKKPRRSRVVKTKEAPTLEHTS